MLRRLLFVFASAALILGAQEKAPAAPAASPALSDGLYAEFTTPRGTFTAELFFQKTPLTVSSFVGRAEGWLAPRDGKPFFTGLKWYRVVPNFVIQSGDPVRSTAADPAKLTEADEAAGHPFPFPDEIAPGLHHHRAGILSMANGGPDTNSSEFFVTLRDTGRLNYLHSVFGQVVRGVELLPQVKADEPFSIRIVRVGAAAQAFDASAAAFTARLAAAKPYAFAKEPGPTAHFADPDNLLPTDPPRAKNFNYKLANFERFTGRKLYARLFAKSPSAAEDEQPGAYMRGLARQLGTEKDGVLVAYFADEKDWRIWFGDDAIAPFLGRKPSAADLAPDGPLHHAKMAFLDDAAARGAKAAAEFIAEGRTLNDAQKFKLVVDEVLDALILTYEPKP